MKSLIISEFPESGISVSARIAIKKNGIDLNLTMLNIKWMEVLFYPFFISD